MINTSNSKAPDELLDCLDEVDCALPEEEELLLELFCEDKPEEPLLWLDALLNDDEGWVLELFPEEDGVEDCDGCDDPLLSLGVLLNDDEGWVLELFPDEDGAEDWDGCDEPEDCEGCEDWLGPLELLRPELLFTGPLLEDEGGGGAPLDEEEGGGGTALLDEDGGTGGTVLLDDEAGGITGELELESAIRVFLFGACARWVR